MRRLITYAAVLANVAINSSLVVTEPHTALAMAPFTLWQAVNFVVEVWR